MLKPLDPFAGQEPGFNHVVAKRVYDDIMALEDDEAARQYAIMAVSGAIQTDLINHEEMISKAFSQFYKAKAEELKKNLVDSYVSKRQGGQDVRPVIAAVEALAKAFSGDDFSHDARSKRAKEQYRTNGGRFGVSHQKVAYSSAKGKSKTTDKTLKTIFGHELDTKGLDPEAKKRVHEAYAQIAAQIAPYTKTPGALLHINYSDGDVHTQAVPGSKEKIKIDPTRRISTTSVSVVSPGDVQGGTFDAIRALGNPELAAAVSGNFDNGLLDPNRLGTFAGQWNDPLDQEDSFNPSRGVFNRLQHGSKLLNDALGDNAPKKVKYALSVGEHAGKLGPEAARVIGPGADRAAYRYRGTEKTPDESLQNAVNHDRSAVRNRIPGQARRLLIYGHDVTDSSGNARGWAPSETLLALRNKLPSTTLSALQLASGHVPPSEGIIFDKSGKLVRQSIGYGDDHYLPFKLTNLKDLKNGEYIRTRSWGGPTTEDVYTGLASGARATTVVSHNGVFTLEFDPSFKGSRRYNDKAARMVARYGQLLDAVRLGKVSTADIHPSRMAELRAKAERTADPDDDFQKYSDELGRLERKERQNPTFSEQQVAETKAEFLAQVAGQQRTRDGHVRTPDEIRTAFIDRALKSHDAQALASTGGTAAERASLRNAIGTQAANQVISDDGLIRALGLGDSYKVFHDQQLDKYKRSLKSLKLDGPGYEAALIALQEQFPYYISKVSYHPWTDAPEQTGSRDTGYVKPRHNRPMEALAGYFDRTIQGAGKATADSIRNQNGRRLHLVSERVNDARETVERAVGREPAARPDSVGAVINQAEAAKKLALHYVGQDYFATDAGELLAGAPVRSSAVVTSPQSEVGRAIAPLLKMTKQQIEDEANEDPRAFIAKVKRAHEAIRSNNLLSQDEDLARGLTRNDGGQVKEFSFEKALLNPTGEFALGRIYERGDHELEDVKDAFRNGDRDIEEARSAYSLPSDITDPELENTIRRGISSIKAKAAENARLTPGNAYGREHDEAKMERELKGLLKARQLRSRHDEAVGRIEAARKAEEEANAPDEVIENILVQPEDQAAYERAVGRGQIPLASARVLESGEGLASEDFLARQRAERQ